MTTYSTDPRYLRLLRILGQIVAGNGNLAMPEQATVTTIDTTADRAQPASPAPDPVPLIVQPCEKVQ